MHLAFPPAHTRDSVAAATDLAVRERERIRGAGLLALAPTGARSTAAKHGFDRYWRNARVHTLHDPIDYTLRDLGRYALAGRLPEPSAYS